MQAQATPGSPSEPAESEDATQLQNTNATRTVLGGRTRLRPYATTSGMLLAGMAAPLSLLNGADSLATAGTWRLVAATSVVALLFAAAATITRHPKLGRSAAAAALLGIGYLALPLLIHAPFAALVALVTASASMALLWNAGTPPVGLSGLRRRPICEGQAQGAAVAALALTVLGAFVHVAGSVVDTLVLAWAMATALAFGLEWAWRSRSSERTRSSIILTAALTACLLIPLLWGRWWWLTASFAAFAATSALVVMPVRHSELERTSWLEPFLGHPERLFVGTFAGLSLLGATLLALPQSSSSGQSMGLSNALFTSTSAVCVTGLVVLDTPVDLTAFARVVVIVLIQIGGLGIMTFSTVALWALGRRLSLRHEGAVASLLSTQDRGRLFASARQILELTAVTEGLGALLLAFAFAHHGDPPAQALWRGLFTSISAFCNAGFALQSASLIPYQSSPVVLHLVSALIIIGGLSPLAVFALPALVRRTTQPVAAQAKLALSSTAVLLLLGFAFILSFEWSGSLADLSPIDRIHNAWFQSVTLRTAGFNSIDLATARAATLTLMMVWMFIGGNPGGTAGGVKTTTVALLFWSIVQAIRGQWTLELFGRRVPERNRSRASVILVIASATGVGSIVAIQLTQRMPTGLAAFEVVSALGTVGLSIGGTSLLDGIGKLIIVVCMFVGRVGGLTLLMFLSSRRPTPMLGRAEEEIDVG